MRFALLHKLSSYLLIASALLALLLSGEVSPVATWLAIAALGASWFVEPTQERRWLTRLWTVGTILFFVYTLLDVVMGEAPALTSGVNFLLFLVVIRLFNRRRSRDYLQLYGLSFLTLVSAAAMNTDLSFAICFLLYVICATWSLTLLHLRREMEENYLLRHTDPDAESRRVEVQRVLQSRRIVGASFLFGTSLLSLGIFLASSVLFFLFPRVGFGLMFGKSRAGISMAGFSDRIELGQFGRIRDNPAVVLRVELPGAPTRPYLGWRWRGISFDRYDGRSWSKSRAGWKQLRRGRQARQFLVRRQVKLEGTPQARVYQEPLSSTNVIFTPGRALAVRLPAKRNYSRADPRYVRRDALGDLSLDGDPSVAVNYFLRFTLDRPSPTELRLASQRQVPPRVQGRYLQTPKLDPRVRLLATTVTQGLENNYDRVAAIERHLRTRYRYTLDLKRTPATAPLADFLFTQRAGHCEYFSTAMVILLRTLGIPARNVNGFYGGEWNKYGRYYTIRQGDAHSWVEVFFPDHGWISFDPTPPGARRRSAESGFFAGISAFIDSIRLKWYKWVIEYDLGKQVGVFRGIANWFRRLFSSAGIGELGRDLKRFFSGPWGIVLLLCVAALAIGLWRRRRRRGPGRQARRVQVRLREVSELYLKLLDSLKRAGYEKPDSWTSRRFVEWLAERRAPTASAVRRFAITYNEVRFGGRVLSLAELRELKILVRQIGGDAARASS